MPRIAAPKKPKDGVHAGTVEFATAVITNWTATLEKKAKDAAKKGDFALAAKYQATVELVTNGAKDDKEIGALSEKLSA